VLFFSLHFFQDVQLETTILKVDTEKVMPKNMIDLYFYQFIFLNGKLLFLLQFVHNVMSLLYQNHEPMLHQEIF
jgi:hypothetical protein